jgi:hypothetical protein
MCVFCAHCDFVPWDMLPYVTYLIMPDKHIHLICEIVGFCGVRVAGLSSRVFVS